MEFKSLTVVVGANDEKKSLIETVDSVMKTSAADITKILLTRPEKVSNECISVIRELEKKYSGVVVDFVQTRPFIGGAMRDGFDNAETSHILLLPGDMAISLTVIPDMIEGVKKEPDVIYKVSRWLNKNSFHDYSLIRKVFNACGQIFLRVLFGTKLTDLTCPVQIMPTELCKSVEWRELNFPILEEVVLVPLRLGMVIKELPAQCFGRTEGHSDNSVKQTSLYLRTALRIRFTQKRKLLKKVNL